MEIMFDKCLRDFLVKRGKTQRELAEYLSISTQAVSKWCRGENMPDIALLPRIAAFLDVSVDELLGVGEIRKQEKMAEYSEESRKLMNKGRTAENVALWRKAHNEFPNDFSVMSLLASALHNQNVATEDDRKETIALCEKILAGSTDNADRDTAIQLISSSYAILGNLEKAKEYAEKGGSIGSSRTYLLLNALDGEELLQHCKAFIMGLVDMLQYPIIKMIRRAPSEEQKIVYIEWYIKLLEHLYDDGNYGFYHIRAYRWNWMASRSYARLENEEKTKEHLEALEYHGAKYDSLSGKVVKYTATLINGHEEDMNYSSTTTEESNLEHLRSTLDGQQFDKFRDCDWFQALVTRLTAK